MLYPAIFVVDASMLISFIYEAVSVSSVYSQDLFSKGYKFVRMVVLGSAQAVLFELYINGVDQEQNRRTIFNTVSFAGYFMMGSTIVVILWLSLRTCCRNKETHPLGDRLTETAFRMLETARKVSQLATLLILATLLAFFQSFVAGLGKHLAEDDSTLFRRISIVFAGILIALAILTTYTGQYFK